MIKLRKGHGKYQAKIIKCAVRKSDFTFYNYCTNSNYNMATLTAPSTGPAIPSTTISSSSSGLPPPHRSSSAPTSSSAPAIPLSSAPIEHVAECSYEFLLAEILQWVERDEKRIAMEAKRVQAKADEMNNNDNNAKEGTEGVDSAPNDNDEAAAAVMAAERSAARIERMGYDVGYRLCERLAQHRPLLGMSSVIIMFFIAKDLY